VEHVAEAGLRIVNRTEFATRADVVVVGAHERLSYEEIRIAAQAVRRGAELIGATRDATFPMPDGPWPGTGAILAAVETAAGRKADVVVGKPEPGMYEAARASLGPGRVLAVGDRLDIDVAGARRAGLDSALVLTGGTTREAADAADPKPTHVADSLGALVLG
jgi:glycerol-1-phosphatase